MKRSGRILIAGGGIGGIAAALALLRAGFDVNVYEQAPELREVGAGVQLSPNGTRVLTHLGLGDEMRRFGTMTSGKEVRLWNTGKSWRTMSLGEEALDRYAYPYLTFHRADLHAMLASAVRREKESAIHLGARCVGFHQAESGVSLKLADGTTVSGDALIGADGVHSGIRQHLHGKDDLRFTGCMAWRGLIPAEAFPSSVTRTGGVSWLGHTAHVLTYPIRQGRFFNFIGMVDRDDWEAESWSAVGSREECAADFEGWHPEVRSMVDAIETHYKWALIVRKPLPRWSVERVTLLGDACHSTLPFLGQGANMAIEDAMVLANCLQWADGTVNKAFSLYDDLRIDRTGRIVNAAAAQTEKVHNPAFADPEKAEALIEAEWSEGRVSERYDWIYSYDAPTLPAREVEARAAY